MSSRSIVARVVGLVCLATLGCGRGPLFEQQVQTSYAEAAALDTFHDFEAARLASAAQLSRLEGLILHDRADPELLGLAVRGWCRYAFLFAWDDAQTARAAGDGQAALYHEERALGGFERAAHYAREVLENAEPGYPEAANALEGYLSAHFTSKDRASMLMWSGCAELGLGALDPDKTRKAQARTRARALLGRALALDPAAGDGTGELFLALVLAEIGGAPAEVKSHLERARTLSQKKLLLVDAAEAIVVDCQAHDEAAFARRASAVLAAGDPSPERRLDNLAAKRWARRYLESVEFRKACVK